MGYLSSRVPRGPYCVPHRKALRKDKSAFAFVKLWNGDEVFYCKGCLDDLLNMADHIEWLEPQWVEFL